MLALIIAKPGALRNSLFSLLATVPQIDIIAGSVGMPSASSMSAQMQPNLVLIESDLPGGQVGKTLAEIQRDWTKARTMVLVDNLAQMQEAELAGADAVLFKGFRAAGLIKIIEELLQQEIKQPERPHPGSICQAHLS